MTDNRPKDMIVMSDGEAEWHRFTDFDQLSRNGQHLEAVKKALRENEPAYLKLYEGQGVRDADGQLHLFETDLNALHRIVSAGSETFEQIYRNVII